MKPWRLCLLCLLILAVTKPHTAHAQPPKQTEGDKKIEAFLAAETDKLSQKFLDGAKTLKEWQQKRPELHRQYMEMLGLWPAPKRTPLKATVTGEFVYEGVRIQNLHFQSVPGLYVTANLYRPAANKGKKLPTILYVCGHSNKGHDGSKSAYWEHPMWFASNGYNCLILDTLQLGEIPGVHHGTYGVPWNHLKAYGLEGKNKPENRWWWVSRGYTPAGVECWNGIRAIDYLLTLDDVDPDKIGVTGISGGGAATFWIAAADERVKVAVPVSGMSDLESYVKHKVVNGHCDCMFLDNTYQWDWTTIAALVAPQPLLFANSDDDKIFPMDGNRRIIDKLHKVYDMYGKGDLVDEYVSKGGHAYRPDLRVAIFKFINKHLKNDAQSPVKDVDFPPIEAKKLRVFPTEADLPKDALNAKIDETFVPKAEVKLPANGKFLEWQAGLLKQLKDKSFRPFPEKIPAAKEAPGEEPPNPKSSSELKEYVTEEGNIAVVVRKKTFADIASGKTVTVFIDSENSVTDLKQLKSFSDEGTIVFLKTRGQALYHWTVKSPPNYVERSHVLLGRTVDQGRVYDIISVIKKLDEGLKAKGKKVKWRVLGHAESGVLGAYAALFEPLITEVAIVNPPKSHQVGPTFLNVLRVLDIPEALGLLSPRKLTLISVGDPIFDRTEEIYKLAGAEDKVTRK